jgi:hypothetical protein
MHPSRFVHAALAALAATVLALPTGCSTTVDQDEASATATAALQAQSQGGLTDGILDTGTPDGLAPDPATAAQTVAAQPSKGLFPVGCATKTQSGDVVTLTMNACTGPFGKVTMNGTMTATFSNSAADVLHVDVEAGDDLTANGTAFHYSAGVDVTYTSTSRTLTYQGHSDGTTKRGVAYARQTNVTIVADATTSCLAIDGTSTGSVGKYDLDISIAGFKGCPGACPTAGVAKATLNGPLVDDKSLQVTFDGSAEGHVSAPRRTFDVPLDCEASEAAD